ncbi:MULTISPECIES: hypothetical protein [Bacillales]|uniref:hypothetical protein n=1 Tax=Bacillales TaxID=1385 RepID=UPI000558C400|nr:MULTISPECIES: hypothetical protein [Bacillaceae]KZM54978.1 hypothetical protein A3Q35_13590 [Aeribacillus pallidus]MED0649198.1 hypothetical protein [Aeribacillus composti]MED4485762.1 hypothetical protein [Aeribacillus pallidus]MED4919455.1 hypothetical protein [Geobacillus thermodenitrificans]
MCNDSSISTWFTSEEVQAKGNSPYVGQIKIVTYKVHKSKLKRYYQASKITNQTLEYVNEFVAGGLGATAKNFLQRGLIALGTYSLAKIIGLGSKPQMNETKKILERMKKG